MKIDIKRLGSEEWVDVQVVAEPQLEAAFGRDDTARSVAVGALLELFADPRIEYGFRVGPLGRVHATLLDAWEVASPVPGFDPAIIQVVVRRRTFAARVAAAAGRLTRRVLRGIG